MMITVVSWINNILFFLPVCETNSSYTHKTREREREREKKKKNGKRKNHAYNQQISFCVTYLNTDQKYLQSDDVTDLHVGEIEQLYSGVLRVS